MSATLSLDHIITRDLDPEFIETVATQLPWMYDRLRQELADNPRLIDDQRLEEHNRRRGQLAVEALRFACERHGVPFDHVRLDCNGQTKLLVRMGRIIILQEAIDAFGEPPKAADYKIRLASTNSAVQQLEFDFGDGRFRTPDWSGCILAVLLHKPTGPQFTQRHRELGGLSLAVPDAAYSHWTRRFDLQEIAMFGRRGAGWLMADATEAELPDQTDEVFVSVKKKNANRETGR